MQRIRKSVPTSIIALLAIYLTASLIHFIHNAEFLQKYPNLPPSWTRAGVYFAWLGMTLVGALGYVLLNRGHPRAGLLFLGIYAALGLESLGHYAFAPMAAHTISMNVTIVMEVAAASALLAGVVRLSLRAVRNGTSAVYDG